jgi:hypothetical protein
VVSVVKKPCGICTFPFFDNLTVLCANSGGDWGALAGGGFVAADNLTWQQYGSHKMLCTFCLFYSRAELVPLVHFVLLFVATFKKNLMLLIIVYDVYL